MYSVDAGYFSRICVYIFMPIVDVSAEHYMLQIYNITFYLAWKEFADLP